MAHREIGSKAESEGATRESVGDAGGRVVTIGWQAVLLPVAAVAAVGLGFLTSRSLNRAGAEVGLRAGQANVAETTALPTGAASQPNDIQSPQLLQSLDANPFPEGQVFDLPSQSHPLIGKPAPDFTMQLLGSDEEVRLSDFAGEAILVDFWGTWCPPCRIEMPWLQTAYEKHKDQGFVILGVNAGERVPPSMVPDTVQTFVDQFGLTFPILLGDNTYEIQRAWSVRGLPTAALISPEGLVVNVHTGMYPNAATLEAELEAILPTAADNS